MSDKPALTEAVYYILLSLCSPRHGYGIMQKAEQMSEGRVRLAAGTLYGALNNLCAKGWIKALPGETGSRKKEYQLYFFVRGRRIKSLRPEKKCLPQN